MHRWLNVEEYYDQVRSDLWRAVDNWVGLTVSMVALSLSLISQTLAVGMSSSQFR